MFENDSYKRFRDIFITSFQCPNLKRAITWENIFVLGNLIIIFYHLTTFEKPSCNSFGGILLQVFNVQNCKGQ